MDTPVIYTIGHSSHSLEYFLDLLRSHSINTIVDVRSFASSVYNPQFNKEALSNFLKRHEVQYLHFAEQFGARHSDPNLLDQDGKVDFAKVRATSHFKNGVERLRQGVQKGFVIALMCSEGEPFDCHRFSMISVALEKDGFQVQHIMKDNTLKTNAQLEQQLLKKYAKKIPQPNIFEPDISTEVQIDVAYRLRNKEIAFSPTSNEEIEDL
jgi:uncharacterized protein (DUF488 family)